MDTDRAVELTAAMIDDGARDRVIVAGPDAETYLQSQLAQEIRNLAPGDARWTFVLDPTGKIDALARVRRTADDRFELDTDAGFGGSLATRINRFKIRVDADVTVEPAERTDPNMEAEILRIDGGWPRMGREIDPGETIPANTGIVDLAVDFQKGCYPGQELVERMHSRGAAAPRSLRIVDLDEGASVGDPVLDDSEEVGTITSISGDGGVGLAYVKRGSTVGRSPAHAPTT